jgi:protein-S-isoprenylcysteine O-methyltransferase Ste14
MKVSVGRLIANIIGFATAMTAALFLPAGTFAWPAGWGFLVLFVGFTVALSLWLLRFNPGLLAERLTVSWPDQKTWDKIFLALARVGFFGWLVLMALDAVRFRWSSMPRWLQAVGAVLLLCSFYVFYRTFRENSYLSPAVRVQTERGHTLVSTGLYRHVRHPMYAGFVLFSFGTALLLGSWYGVLGALVVIAMVARRAVFEERVLSNELEGYDEYMRRVRYRLVPRVW